MFPDQLGFDFGSSHKPRESDCDGLARWRAARREAMEDLALKQGLPLGHRVRIEFECGPPLEGTLVLHEETLFIDDRKTTKLHLRCRRH